MSRWDADVIVVGAGPAGSTTAALLADAGCTVLLIDRARFPREKACAEYLSPGVVQELDRLGLLPALDAVAPAWLRAMRVTNGRASFELAFDAANPPRQAMGIPRSALDQVLLEHAQASGARIWEGVRTRGAAVIDGQVSGVIISDGGRGGLLRAPIIVGADGVHSTIARSLGLDRPVRWPQRLGLVARFAGASRLRDHGEMHVGETGYCGLAPVGDDLVNVGLVGPLGHKPPGEPTTGYFERRLQEIPCVSEALAGARRVTPVRGVGPLHGRRRQVAGRGFLLVGDAAGFLDPFTGEGIFRALQGAHLAAAAILNALNQGITTPVGYAAARRAAFQEKELLCLLIQGFLSSNTIFDYVLDQTSRRHHVAATLSGVLGDFAPAGPALRPSFLWSLLKPWG